MFNPEMILLEVEKAIADRKPSNCGKWVLFISDGGIFARPFEIKSPAVYTIMFVNEDLARNGFSASQWNMIISRIAHYIDKGNT